MSEASYLRGLPEAEVYLAVEQLDEWDYPRELVKGEVQDAAWYRLGEHLVFWFLWVPGYDKGLTVCVCADPKVRGGLLQSRHMRTIQVIAELHGAEQLVFLEGSDELGFKTAPRVGRFLESQGAKRDATGWVMELGEEMVCRS